MAYDLAAMRNHFRFLVSDPRGLAITNNDVRDLYINPSYQDWFRRMERRPGSFLTFSIPSGNKVTSPATTGDQVIAAIEHCSLSVSGKELGLIREEFIRLRWLQETEGATGQPESWAVDPIFVDQQSWIDPQIATYPIPNATFTAALYIIQSLTLFSGDTSQALLDNVSARMVTRLAAFRAATDLGLPIERLKAIAAPLPTWAAAAFKMSWLIEEKPLPREVALSYRKDPVNA